MGDDELLGYAFDTTRSGLALIGADGLIIRLNEAGAALVQRRPQDLVGQRFHDHVHADDLSAALETLAAIVSEGHAGPIDVRVHLPDGDLAWIRCRGTLLPSEPPVTYITFDDAGPARDVAERLEQTTAELRRERDELVARAAQQAAVVELGSMALAGGPVEHLVDRCRKLVETTLDVAHCAVSIDLGRDARVVAASSGLTRREEDGPLDGPGLLAASVADHSGSMLVADIEGHERFVPTPALRALGIRSLAAAPIECRSGARGVVVVGSGQPAALRADDLLFLEAIANVLASAVDAKRSLDDLRHNALHDALTGLPNRVLLLDRLEVALEQAAGRGTQVAVLVCDVDRFKVVNDGLGHAAGDEVLRLVADRLKAQVRPGDTVGRFGGDEFVVVCPDVSELAAVVAIADRLAAAFATPMRVLGTDLVVSASIGIALGAGGSSDVPASLLRDADAAMYRAKDRGRNRYELFDDDMRTRAGTRVRTESELRRALERGELRLHYQPVLDTSSAALVGVEALVRWEHPTRGLLLPADFVGVAIDSGMAPELGGWAFEEAAHQAARWARAGADGPAWVAVNLSPQQLTDPRLLERIDHALTSADVAAARLRVEITEEGLVEDTARTAEMLVGLRDRGIGISVDDFGSGYSSLAYLRRLPVDVLKLDQRFVAGLGQDTDDMVIAAAVVVMAQALGLQVVAEGVETIEQLEVLRSMGCDHVQGYLFARPLPADELTAWLAAR